MWGKGCLSTVKKFETDRAFAGWHTMNRSPWTVVALAWVLAGCSGSAPAPDAGSAADAGPVVDAGPVDADGGLADGGALDAGQDCSPGVSLGADDVRTQNGVVRGAWSGGVRAFKGIPFAKPPVGALRWRLPEPHGCFAEPVRPATAFGAVCPQYLTDGGVTGDEDCLTLTVWVPDAPPPASGKPVMVFIHGGGHELGSASKDITDGALLAKAQGNLVVSMEYRLGPFGFLAHPALSAEGGVQKSGDYGMHDQLAALRWVQANIAAFGGDPAKVMIFGESAGAVSVCRLVASPLAAGLFSAAVMESGACTARPLADAEQRGVAIADRFGCPDAGLSTACLRAKGTAEVMTGFDPLSNLSAEIGDLTFDGVIDGYAVPDLPRKTIATGQFNHVPLMVVSNANELSRGVPNIATEAQFRLAIGAFLGARATPALMDQIVAQYPVATYGTWKAAYVAALSEVTIICSGRRDALTAAAHSTKPVYRAIFADVADKAFGAVKELGAFHGAELLWLFGTLNTTAVSVLAGTEDQKTVAAMQAAWSAFAASGVPTAAPVPVWPAYQASNEQVVRFADGATVTPDPFTANCKFWEAAALQ